MITRRQVTAKAKKLGAIIEYSHIGIIYEITIEAPSGYVWKDEPDIHELVFSQYGSYNELYTEAFERMSQGITKCEIVDCEWCQS